MDIETASDFDTWFAGLRDRKARAKILARLDRVQLGHLGNAQPIGSGVSELKIDFGPGYRIYFVQRNETLIVILGGGDKDTQQRDIKRAKRLAAKLKEGS